MHVKKKQFKSTVLFIIIQLCLAVSFIFLMDKYNNGQNAFILNLFFYFFIFILPIFIYVYKVLGKNPFAYLKLTGNSLSGIVKGLLISLFIALIFLISNRFKFNFDMGKIGVSIGLMLAGVFEEIPFRGLYLKELCTRFGFWKANIITSLLFALLHSQRIIEGDFISTVMLFIIGIWLGYIFEKTKSLWSPIIVHSVYNLLTVLF